jgi:para-nitrobenzyl esterase
MKLLIAGLAAIALAAPAAALAADTAAPAAAPTASAKPSVETTTIGDLLANPSSKAVLEKDMPALVTYPGLDQIKGMTLRDISKYPQANLDDAKLAAIQTDLDASGAH